jgi:DNA-directed RNA polymerase sigma subunit (sigma70/sigma32)
MSASIIAEINKLETKRLEIRDVILLEFSKGNYKSKAIIMGTKNLSQLCEEHMKLITSIAKLHQKNEGMI